MSRRLGVEGASGEDDPHSRFGPHGQGQVERLEHQAGRARGADVDRQVARRVRCRSENQLPRSNLGAGHFRLPKDRGGFDRLQVLGPQSRLVSVGPDPGHSERSTGQQRQRQRRAEDLTAPLAVGAVQIDKSFRGIS